MGIWEIWGFIIKKFCFDILVMFGAKCVFFILFPSAEGVRGPLVIQQREATIFFFFFVVRSFEEDMREGNRADSPGERTALTCLCPLSTKKGVL